MSKEDITKISYVPYDADEFGNPKVSFLYKGEEVWISEPPDVILVGVDNANSWIWDKYGFLLSTIGEK